MTQDSDLRARLHRLEADLLAVRREIAGETEPLPVAPFDTLEVRVGPLWCAVPTAPIHEVIQMIGYQPVPDAPEWVLGSLRYGRKIVPLIDLERRLLQQPTRIHPSLVIAIAGRENLKGFVVSEIGDIRRVAPEEIAPPAQGISHASFLVGTIADAKRNSILLLSLDRLSREYIFDEN